MDEPTGNGALLARDRYRAATVRDPMGTDGRRVEPRSWRAN